jgi:hypothetical protein
MGCFAPWVFLDNVGQTWALGMNAAGQLTFTQISNPPANNAAASVPLKDIITGATVKLVVVFTASPVLTPIASSGPTIGSYVPLTRPGVGTYWLQVASGALVLNQQNAIYTPDPVIGELFNYDLANPAVNPPNLPFAGLPSGFPGGFLPPYSQPGGLTTPSFPAQQSGVPYSEQPSDVGLTSQETGIPFEQGMGMNTLGCNHWINNYEQVWTTVGCQTYCLVRCPLCGYVQEMFPLTEAYSEYREHISS